MSWSHRSHTLPRQPLPISDDVFLFSHHQDQEQEDFGAATLSNKTTRDTLPSSTSEPTLSTIFVLKGLKNLNESTSKRSIVTVDSVKLRRRDSLLVTPNQIRARALTLPLILSNARTGMSILPLAPITSQNPISISEGLYLNPNHTFTSLTSIVPRTPLRISTHPHFTRETSGSVSGSDSASCSEPESESESESVCSTPCSSFDDHDQISPSTPCPHNTIHDLVSLFPAALIYTEQKKEEQRSTWRSPAASSPHLGYPLNMTRSKRRKISEDEYSYLDTSPGAGLEEPMGNVKLVAALSRSKP